MSVSTADQLLREALEVLEDYQVTAGDEDEDNNDDVIAMCGKITKYLDSSKEVALAEAMTRSIQKGATVCCNGHFIDQDGLCLTKAVCTGATTEGQESQGMTPRCCFISYGKPKIRHMNIDSAAVHAGKMNQKMKVYFNAYECPRCLRQPRGVASLTDALHLLRQARGPAMKGTVIDRQHGCCPSKGCQYGRGIRPKKIKA